MMHSNTKANKMTQLTDNIFSVEVPDDAHNFRILSFSQPNTLSYDYSITKGERITKGLIGMVDLSPGTWIFLFTTRGATEEQAHEIIESVTTANEIPVYWDYQHSMWMKSSVASLQSLLRSKGCNTERNYAILKLNEDGTQKDDKATSRRNKSLD